jgi:O-antigen/teichoic acid export membrane protein
VIPSSRERLLPNLLALSFRQAVTGIATLCGLLALSRMLEPADFATYGYVTAAMLLAAAVGDLGLGGGLIAEGASDDRIRLSFGLQLIVWVPLGLILLAIAVVADPYGFQYAASVLLVACFVIFGLQSLPTALLERSRKFAVIAQLESLQRIVFVVASVGFAYVAWDNIAVPLAGALAGIIGYAIALVATRWHWAPRLQGAWGNFTGFSSNWWQSRVAGQLNYAVYPLLGGLLFTSQQVGWLVWAIAVTSIPSMIAPLSTRVLLPNLTAIDEERRLDTFAWVFRAVLIVSLPAVAALFACARPVTTYFFGPQWIGAIPLLRLECVTSLLWIILIPPVPLLFLVVRPATVRRVFVAWTAVIWFGAVLLSGVAGYYAITLTQIGVALVVLVIFDRLLARAVPFSLLRRASPAVCVCSVFAASGWWLAEEFATNALRTILVGVTVYGVAVPLTAAVMCGPPLRGRGRRDLGTAHGSD